MDQSEWELLLAIRNEMNANMMALDATTQEKFVELLVKSLEGKGDCSPVTVSRTSRDGLPSFGSKQKGL